MTFIYLNVSNTGTKISVSYKHTTTAPIKSAVQTVDKVGVVAKRGEII